MTIYLHNYQASESIESSLDTIKLSAKIAAIKRLGLEIQEFSTPTSKYGSFKEKSVFSHGPRAACDHILEFILSGFPLWNQRQDYMSWGEGVSLFAAVAIDSIRIGYEDTCDIHGPLDLESKEVLEELLVCAKNSVDSWKEGLVASSMEQ